METANFLDLAATCAELSGTAGSAAVKVNQLLRIYRDVPDELRELQAQIALGKQTLDRLLPLLDRDEPAFQYASDVEALDLHFKALAFVIKVVQDDVARVEQARSSPFPEWASVVSIWELSDIVESEARLGKQLSALEVYLKVSRPDSEASKQVEITDSGDRACLIAAWDDAAEYISAPTTQAASPQVPLVSIDDTQSPQSPRTEHSESTSSVTDTSQHTQNSVTLHRASASSSHTGSSSSPAVPNYATLSRMLLPTPSTDPSQSRGRRGSYWRDAFKTQSMYMPSARKLKSIAMLQKPSASTQDLTAQLEEVNPAEFRSRVSEYARGVSPAWELKSVPSKKKGTKLRYRNKFTRDPADDLPPEKLQNQMKIVEQPLWDAILHKELEKVTKIMEHRWTDNLIVEKRDKMTALHVAASLGICSIVQKLISLGANPNHTDRFGATAMHYAADFGCSNCLNILALANGKVDLEAPKTHVKTALYYAAKRGNAEATHTLLNHGAHVYTLNAAPQDSVLYAAVESGSLEVCEAILNKGGNPGESFDTLALAAETSREILNLLAGAGADLNIHDAQNETLLHKYIKKSDADMVSFLLRLGAEPKSAADNLGRMTLHLAIDKGGYPDSAAMTKALLQAGDNPDVKNSLGQTPLHQAVLWGRADVAAALCSGGANMDIGDSKGVTPYQETQILNYSKRAGNTTLADFPGTKALLERWRHGSAPKIAEADGQPQALPEVDGQATMKPRVAAELGNTAKALHELSPASKPAELGGSKVAYHEMDASIVRKPVMIAELP